MPSFNALLLLRGTGDKKVHVIDTIASRWEDLAIALGFDGHMIDFVKRDFIQDSKGASCKILHMWLDPENVHNYNLKTPVSWSTLLQCLRDIEYSTLCDDIQTIIDQPPILQSVDL